MKITAHIISDGGWESRDDPGPFDNLADAAFAAGKSIGYLNCDGWEATVTYEIEHEGAEK